MNNNISPELYGEIIRSFGSLRDMQRAFETAAERKGIFYLIATSDARLRLAYESETPVGTVLHRSADALDFAVLSERYAAVIANRPRYPHP